MCLLTASSTIPLLRSHAELSVCLSFGVVNMDEYYVKRQGHHRFLSGSTIPCLVSIMSSLLKSLIITSSVSIWGAELSSESQALLLSFLARNFFAVKVSRGTQPMLVLIIFIKNDVQYKQQSMTVLLIECLWNTISTHVLFILIKH